MCVLLENKKLDKMFNVLIPKSTNIQKGKLLNWATEYIAIGLKGKKENEKCT